VSVDVPTLAGGDTLQSVLAHAVADVDLPTEESVFDDEASQSIVGEAYERVASTPVDSSADARDVVTDVADELTGASLTLRHRAKPGLEAAATATYNFLQSGDPADLDAGPFGDVDDRFVTGANTWAEGKYESAVDAFADAAAEATDSDSAVAAHVLAGAGSHEAGNDAAAIDHIRLALRTDQTGWTPLLVGIAAASNQPRRFRDGNHRAGLYLRWTANTPPDCTVEVAVRHSAADDWARLEHADCSPLERVTPETELLFDLSGPVPAFPELLGYYVTVGAMRDDSPTEALTSDRLCFSGPDADGVAETLVVER